MKIITISLFFLLCILILSACKPSSKQSKETAQAQYIQYCGACHGRNVDYLKEKEEWMFEKSYDGIFKAIKNGVKEQGMPAYAETLSDEEIKNIVLFMMEKLEMKRD